ncbi:MAG: lamin tail domain-containing protein, partial [Bacteroidales bacterium]
MKLRTVLITLVLTTLVLNGCVKDEVYQGPPIISNLVLTPQAPGPSDAVTVTVMATDMNGIEKVTLFYKIEAGEYTSIPMTSSGENLFSGQIPGQDAGVTISYYVEAENVSGMKTLHPSGAPATAAAYTVGAPSIVINEIYSRGVPADPDWVEFYNNSDVTVDISGYLIYDGGGQTGGKPKKEIPAGTILQPRAFYVIVTDDEDPSGFGLSSGGEEIWFESPSGTIVDNVAFSAMDVTQSYGRMPDGSPNWQLLDNITRGTANDDSPPAAVIKMNELFSRGTTENPDWVELYNASNFAADISGYKIYDSGGQAGTKPKKEVPAGTIIPAGGFYVIVTDDEHESGFGLSSGGEQVWLENTAGTIIDDVTFGAMSETESWGRFPDGSDTWQLLPVQTPGAPNSNIPPVVNIVMNELYSRGTTEDPDWVEFFNPSSQSVDISGYKIYDSGGQAGTKPKKEVPAGTIIPAGGFYVIVTDDEHESGFGLSSGGEQ